MRKLLTICSLVVLLIGATGFNASAAFITGSIGFSGGDTTGGSLATATQITFANMIVNALPAPTGTYAAVPGNTSVTMKPLAFSPFVPNNPLWTFTVGPTTYSFDAATATVQTQNTNFLNIMGTGTAHVTGSTDTPFFYSVTATDAAGGGTSITAGVSNNAQVVPVPPSLVMLGSGLIGFVAIRRRARR